MSRSQSFRRFEDHFAAVQAAATALPSAVLPVDAHLPAGLVIARDVDAALSIPPFANSAMDGFIVRVADVAATPVTLPVAGDVPAGSPPVEVPPGHAVRIMTGAPVSDVPGHLVVPVEDTSAGPGPQALPDSVTIHRVNPARAHIRLAGEGLRAGDVAVRAGTTVDAGTIAALLSAGAESVSVHRAPRVAVVSTGDELSVRGAPAGIGGAPTIVDSNGPMLAALAAATGPVEVTSAHTGDSDEAFGQRIRELAATHDAVFTTGGISTGAFDVVRSVLSAADTDSWFGEVNHRPGAPQGLCRIGGTPVLSFPGNPVAAFVSFHLYGHALLRILRGLAPAASPWHRPQVTATAVADLRSDGNRWSLVPVRVAFDATGATAQPYVRGHRGSHMVAALVGVNGLVALPPGSPAGSAGISEGQPVDVFLL